MRWVSWAQRELDENFRLTRNRVPPPCRLLIAQRAADGETRFVQDVGVNHRRGNVLVPKKILNGTDIVAVFQQMYGETVPERVAARGFCNAITSDPVDVKPFRYGCCNAL